MNTPIAVRIECAKGEVMNALQKVQQENSLPPCVMDGVLSSVLAEVRAEAKLEIINATNAMMHEKNKELEKINEELNKAKAAAKKVLKDEPEIVSKSDTGQQGGHPEE